MKIAVATNNYKNVVGHVGRCKGFILYNVKDGEIIERKEIENPFAKHPHHGYGNNGNGHRHNHDELAATLEGAEILLCKQAGWGLIYSMNERGIKVLFTNERFGDDAVVKLERSVLQFTNPMEEE